VTDETHWGVSDRWDLPEDDQGDCEDYQLLKRKLLAEKGLPRRALRMAVVIDQDDIGHAVLVSELIGFVLDNRTSSVLPWHRTGYLFVKGEGAIAGAGIGSADHSRRWLRLDVEQTLAAA
jgi:predicted transglutaminase-like cysteine proteinase